jgi:hypothetical protein
MIIIIATQPSSFRRLRGRSRAADPIRSIWGHRVGNPIENPEDHDFIDRVANKLSGRYHR